MLASLTGIPGGVSLLPSGTEAAVGVRMLTDGATVKRAWLWILKNTLNRLTVRLAKSGRGPFSLVRHVGRKSRTTFETPIMVAAVSTGFVAELTYGEQVNWYRNVVAAGSCELLVKGTTHRVVAIEKYPTDQGRRAFGAVPRLVLRLTRRTEFRLLRTSTPA